MTKEPGQPPKAVNIIRPNANYGILHNTTSTSSSGSSNSGSMIYSQQQQKRNGHSSSTIHSANSSVLSSNRKPRVNGASKMVEKPVLNLYHPPTRKPSYDRSNSSSMVTTATNHARPAIEIYKPQQQQQQQHHFQQQQQQQQQQQPQPQRMTKSLTAPSLTNSEPIHPISNSRPISPFHIRPSHRSVLGPIVTPVAATTTQSPTSIEVDHGHPRSLLEGVNKMIHDEDEDDTTVINDDVQQRLYQNNENDDDDDSEEEEVDTIEEEEEEEEEPVINEARVNRKIADLELSINSLLTVNAMLEATVRKQASQLNQMKQKMLSGESVDKILDEVTIIDVVEDHHGEADEDEEDWDKDVLFQRLRKVTEYMIEQGQKSIEYEYKILGRVLSNYEQNEEEDDDDDEEEEDDTIQDNTTPTTALHPPLPAKSKSDTLSPKSIPVPSSIPLLTTHLNNRIPKKSKKRM